MKKLFIILSVLFVLTGCQANKDYGAVLWDTNGFNYAIIELQNGEIVEGYIDSWVDFEDGEQLQIKMNGIIYLTSSYNCTLIYK